MLTSTVIRTNPRKAGRKVECFAMDVEDQNDCILEYRGDMSDLGCGCAPHVGISDAGRDCGLLAFRKHGFAGP